MPESARRAGVDVAARAPVAPSCSPGSAPALAGLLVAGRLGTGYPNAGQGFELDAIVAVVLGGTSLGRRARHDRRHVGGGAAARRRSRIVLNLLEVSAFVQMVVKGLIVVAAIVANQARPAGSAAARRLPVTGAAGRDAG